MSHQIEIYTYPVSKDKKEITAELQSYVAQACWQEGGHLSNIQWFGDTIYDSQEEAERFINKYCEGKWYACVAVKCYDTAGVQGNKKVDELRDARRAAYKAYSEARNEPHFKTAKAEFIGCKECGSKIARKYLKNNYCPVCGADLRPASTLDRITRVYRKAENIAEKLHAAECAAAKKENMVDWVVRIEFHQ